MRRERKGLVIVVLDPAKDRTQSLQNAWQTLILLHHLVQEVCTEGIRVCLGGCMVTNEARWKLTVPPYTAVLCTWKATKKHWK